VRRLAAGLLLSRTGDQLTTIALLWFVLDLTGSGVAVGLVLLCAGLPPVVTGPLLGRLLDRWPVRRVLIADNLLRAAQIGAIPVLYWLGRLDMPLIYGLSLAAGALLPATDVGVRVVLPQLVDEPELEPANAMLSIGDQVSALVGPAAGGVLVGLVGAPPVLLLDAASFLAMAAFVRSLPDTPAPPGRPAAGPRLGRPPAAPRPHRPHRPGRHPGLLPGLRAARAGPAAVQPRRPPRRPRRLWPALVGLWRWRAARPGDHPGRQAAATRHRPGRQRPAVGRDPAAPDRHHQHRPGGPGPCRRRAGLGALHHP
jgi:MFS family permease